MPKDDQMIRLAQDFAVRFPHAISVEPENRAGRQRATHSGAFFSFAAHLPVGVQDALAFSVSAKAGLQIEAWLESLPAISPKGGLAEDLSSALRMTFPDHAIDPAVRGPEVLPFSIRLPAPRYDGAGYLEAAGRPAARFGPKPTAVPPSDVVVLPSPVARPIPLKTILEALMAADCRARLVLAIRPIRLKAFALRQIAATTEKIEEGLSDPLLPLVERVQLGRARDVLQSWQTCAAGVSADLCLESKEQLPAWFCEALRTTAYGYHTQGKSIDAETWFDLSLAWSRADIPRIALPGTIALQRLARSRAPEASSPTKDAVMIGQTVGGQPVMLSDHQRGQHLYLCGATGTGKSSLIRRMVRDDVRRGFGVAVIDPHGDLIEDLRGDLEKEALDRVIHADMSQSDTDFRLNLLENDGLTPGHHANFVANQLIMTFTRILYRDVPDAHGPMFASYFRNALMLLMLGSEDQAHLGDFDRVFTDRLFRKDLLERCPDEHVLRFWIGIAQRVTHVEASLENIAPYIVSKLTQFVGNPMLRPILCAPHSSVDFYEMMQKGNVLLANLAKGVAGEADSRLMGALLTTKIFAAAMRRGQLPRAERRPFRVYLDEFQSYGTDLAGDMLAEGRKFGLELTLANQSTSQIDGRNRGDDIAHAILANCGTTLAFRTSPLGASLMADWIGDGIDRSDLVKLPNYTAVGRLSSASGVPMTRKFQTLGE